MKLKWIVFDLDDTLLNTTELLIPIARTPAFEERIRQPLPLMPGALNNLHYLKDRYFLALLTQGRTEAQAQKVKSLGVESLFRQLYFADPAQQTTKGYFFEQLLKSQRLHPLEVLSVGNRRSTDIREAKKLGIRTCLFKHGEHQDEPIVVPEDVADIEIRSHQELISKWQL
jgi:putative hydrolase of the HAD superfamily